MPMFMQLLALGALVGALISYRRHRSIPPVLLSIVSTALIIYGIRNYLDTHYIYPGLMGLLIVSVWNNILEQRLKTQKTEAETGTAQ